MWPLPRTPSASVNRFRACGMLWVQTADSAHGAGVLEGVGVCLTRVTCLDGRCRSALLASSISKLRALPMLDGWLGQSPAGFVPGMLRIGRTLTPADAVLRVTGSTPA
jgi:hypothetical protein